MLWDFLWEQIRCMGEPGKGKHGAKLIGGRIEALEGFPTKVFAFACKGHVTKHDYETVLIPAVEEAISFYWRHHLWCIA